MVFILKYFSRKRAGDEVKQGGPFEGKDISIAPQKSPSSLAPSQMFSCSSVTREQFLVYCPLSDNSSHKQI